MDTRGTERSEATIISTPGEDYVLDTSPWIEAIEALVDDSGGLRHDYDTSLLLKCMKEAKSFDQRMRINFLLLSTHSLGLLQRTVSDDSIIHCIENWWDEAATGASGMIRLLLKLLDHLPFRLETLLRHKLAKKVSKLAKNAQLDNCIQDMARGLENKWRRLLEDYNDPELLSGKMVKKDLSPSIQASNVVQNKVNVVAPTPMQTLGTKKVCIVDDVDMIYLEL